jgi:hypothetical protein
MAVPPRSTPATTGTMVLLTSSVLTRTAYQTEPPDFAKFRLTYRRQAGR